MKPLRLLTGGLLLAISGTAAQVTIFSDDFTEEPNSTTLNYNSFVNWTVTRGFVDLLDSSNCGGAPRCVDLDGSAGGPGTTMVSKSTVTLVDGGTYTMTLQFNTGAEADPIGASVGIFGQSEGGGYTFPHTLSFSFTVGGGQGGPANLSILDNAALNFTGPYLNSVLLTQTVADLPEPATMLLVGGALVLVGVLRRRRP